MGTEKKTEKCTLWDLQHEIFLRQVANFTCKQRKTVTLQRKTKKHYRNNFYGLSELALAYFVVFDFDIIIVLE